MSAEYKRNGGTSASKKVYALEQRLRPLANAIVASDEASLAALRAKALVVLWEACPTCIDGLGEWDFPDDCGATRSLLDAVAELTGLRTLLTEVEARFTATADAIAAGDAAFRV